MLPLLLVVVAEEQELGEDWQTKSRRRGARCTDADSGSCDELTMVVAEEQGQELGEDCQTESRRRGMYVCLNAHQRQSGLYFKRNKRVMWITGL